MIFTQLIQTNLRTKELGKNIEYYNRLDSTNTEAWELVEENKNHGTIIITENQTNGKGQKNKSTSFSSILLNYVLPLPADSTRRELSRTVLKIV